MNAEGGTGPLIAIADDHPLIRAAMRDLLARLVPAPRIVEAADLPSVLALAEGDPAPDLMLVDLTMPGGHGLDGIRALRERAPHVPVAVVSADEDPATVQALLALGVAGFIPKSDAGDRVAHAVQLMLAGGNYVPLRLLGGGGAAAADGPALTDRQRDVLRWLALGRSNKEIARELGISEGTVKVHLLSVFRTLGVRNRTEAVLAAQHLLG